MTVPYLTNIAQCWLGQWIRELPRRLFRCHPAAALALVLGSFIASVSMLVIAPEVPLYASLSAILFLPNWVWPGVLLEGIRAHHGTDLRRRCNTVWACIACEILIDGVLLTILAELADSLRFAATLEAVTWCTASAIALWVSWTVAKTLVEAEDRWYTPSTRVIGTFVQFLFLPLCVFVLQRRAQGLAAFVVERARTPNDKKRARNRNS